MTEITTDVICPFLIDSGLSRGQSVRLGESLDTIISQHAYPEPIGKLVAQAAVLTTLLASTIKYDGVFTLQVRPRRRRGVPVGDRHDDGGNDSRIRPFRRRKNGSRAEKNRTGRRF
mgnify:CR=1 FL=1